MENIIVKAEPDLEVDVWTNGFDQAQEQNLLHCHIMEAEVLIKEEVLGLTDTVSRDSQLNTASSSLEINYLHNDAPDGCLETFTSGLQYCQDTVDANNEEKQAVLKPFQCDECPKTFARKDKLKYHKDSCHFGKPIKCKQCEFRCASSDDLLPHVMRVHWGKFRYNCTECNLQFHGRTLLARHRVVHSKIKPFTCNVCERSFSFEETLKQHMLVHSDVKPHACGICPKTFRAISTLNRHLSMHLRQRRQQSQML